MRALFFATLATIILGGFADGFHPEIYIFGIPSFTVAFQAIYVMIKAT